MPFLPPNQQRQSTEGKAEKLKTLSLYLQNNRKLTDPSTRAKWRSRILASGFASARLMCPTWTPFTLSTFTAFGSKRLCGSRTNDTISWLFTYETPQKLQWALKSNRSFYDKSFHIIKCTNKAIERKKNLDICFTFNMPVYGMETV